MINIESRLSRLAEMVRGCHCVADIGCDHGRLSCSLLQKFDVKSVIAIDISEACLKKAELLAKKCRLSDRLSLRCGDGALTLNPNEADGIVIAGMGGELIAQIIQQSDDVMRSARHIAMQPMHGIAKLRRHLFFNGYEITKDVVLKENGHWYQLLCAKSGTPAPIPEGFPPDLFLVGYKAALSGDANVALYVEFLIRSYENRMNAAQKGSFVPEKLTHDYANLCKALDFIRKLNN